MLSRAANLIWDRFFSSDPFFVVFHVTARCNAKCQFCFNWDNISAWQSRNELRLDEIEKITRSIGTCYQLTIGGGEPFLRKDLAEIVGLFHRNCSTQGITIPTNGVLTDRVAGILPRILEENPRAHIRLGLSLPEIGDKLTEVYQVENSFAKHQATYRLLADMAKRYPNLTLSSGVVCNKYNAGRVKEILDYIIAEMPGVKPQLAMVRGKPRLADAKDVDLDEVRDVYAHYLNLFPDPDNRPLGGLISTLGEMVNELTLDIAEQDRDFLPCRSGEKLVVIYDNGDVYPCEYLDKKIGNVRDWNYDVRAILASDKARETVQEIIETKCHCTWECANYNNMIFSPRHMAKLVLRHARKTMTGSFRGGKNGTAAAP